MRNLLERAQVQDFTDGKIAIRIWLMHLGEAPRAFVMMSRFPLSMSFRSMHHMEPNVVAGPRRVGARRAQ
jgi:hypothetical protein